LKKGMNAKGNKRMWDEYYSNSLVEQDFDRLVKKNKLDHPYVREVFAACKKGDRTLEFGCGKGTMSALLAMHRHAKPTLVDFSPTAIRYAKKLFHRAGVKGRFEVCDFTKMPFPDESFDLAYGKGVLEHVPGYETGMRRGLKEIRRVLKPGGRVVFTVPNSWRPDGNRFFMRALKADYIQYDFSVAQAERICEELGFVVEKKFGDGVFYITPGELIRFFKVDKLVGKRLPLVENKELRAEARANSSPLWRANQKYFVFLNWLNKKVVPPAELGLMFGLRIRKPEE